MPLINQHKYIGVDKWCFQTSYRSLKLIDYGCNHRCTRTLQQLYKVTTRCRILHTHLALAECCRNLPIEVRAIGYKDNSRIAN